MKKVKQALPKTEDQLIQEALSSWESRRMGSIDLLPEPTFEIQVGDDVEVGNLKECKVVLLAHNSKVDVIKYHDFGLKYGQPYDAGYAYSVWPVVDVFPLKEITESCVSERSWMFPYTTRDLRHIFHLYCNDGFIDNPDYQRGYVWTDVDKEKLIESIMLGYPIGGFVVKANRYPELRSEIIDGKQRINAIVDFMSGKYKYKGLYYWNLSRSDRNNFEDRSIQWCELPETATRKDCLKMFLACNSCGVPQDESHIQKVKELYAKEIV